MTLPDGLAGADVKVYMDGVEVGGSPVAIDGLAASTAYSRVFKAVATLEGKEYASKEVTVSFTTTAAPIAGDTSSYDIRAAVKAADNTIEWSAPEGFGDEARAQKCVSGDYIRLGNCNGAGVWAGNLAVEMTNTADGKIVATIKFSDNDAPENPLVNVFVNNQFKRADKQDDGTYRVESNYEYVNGKVVTWYLFIEANGLNVYTRSFTYTINNSDKDEQTFTIANWAKENLKWGEMNFTRGEVEFFSDTEEATADNNRFWSHTGRPVDGTSKGTTGTYWNPRFEYVIANPVTGNADDYVPLCVAMRFDNGAMIPSNFVPAVFINGVRYQLKPEPTVVNMYTAVTAEYTAAAAPSGMARVEGMQDNKFGQGTYPIRFRFEYLSIKEGNGYSVTPDSNFNVYAKEPTTGIDAVEAAGETPVEYYTLQGVRVADPQGGIFIRRQGADVTKVVIR